MNRRKFLCTTAASAALAAMPRALLAKAIPTVPARLTIQPDRPGFAIAPDFLGLSYESAQLAHPEFFSAQNTSYAGFLSALRPNGVLRIGGNTSGYSFWTPHPSQTATQQTSDAVGPDKGHAPPPPTQTTPQSIRNLREFLDHIQWRCIYGLNLLRGTPEQSADEAAFVSATLGDRLVCFQFGNEVDNFAHKGLRPPNYGYADFALEWRKFHQAVKARVPNASYAGPDSAITGAWVEQFAQQFGKQVMLLTTHYYAEGPPSDPSMTIGRLLNSNNPRWDNGVPNIRKAMAESHLPFRLTETNSCYHGGKPGVSNTFASSLWALDVMFQLVLLGGNGINFHGGGYGWYAPIVGNIPNGFSARPEYYALLLFSQLLGGRMVASQLDAASPATDSSPTLVCHALRNPTGKLQTVVINKASRTDVRLTLQANTAGERVSIQRLIAPTLEDESDVTLAGAPVGAQGAWRAERVEHVTLKNGGAECSIPAASAALLSWG